MEVREVSLRRRRLTQIPVFGLRDHSDHLNIRLGSRSLIIDQPKAPADRIAGRKIAFGKALSFAVRDRASQNLSVLVKVGRMTEQNHTPRLPKKNL